MFLATGENNKTWRPDVTAIALKSGKPYTVGVEYIQQMAGPFGQTIQGDYKITQYKQNEKREFIVTAGPARPTGMYTIEPQKNGTKLTFMLSLQPKGFIKLLSPMIQKQMQKDIAHLTTLKKILAEESPQNRNVS